MGGQVILATFACDGPDHCSGLNMVCYSPKSLNDELGAGFEIVDSAHDMHHTAFGTEQKFTYYFLCKDSK